MCVREKNLIGLADKCKQRDRQKDSEKEKKRQGGRETERLR